MCGISAFLSKCRKEKICFDVLISSLKALQNRGYDSCGIIDGNFECLLRATKKSELYGTIIDESVPLNDEIFKEKKNTTKNFSDSLPEDAVSQIELRRNLFPKQARIGIAHTRWATSGNKTVNNAHPHLSFDKKIAVIHNGIIENYESLKENMNCTFYSETDTEVISNWLAIEMEKYQPSINNMDIVLKKAIGILEGSWAIVVIHKDIKDTIFVVRNGNPILIGVNTKNSTLMVASETSGFVNNVNQYAFLPDKKFLHIKLGYNKKQIINQIPSLKFKNVPKEEIELKPGKFPYFMAKEIYDQENAIHGPCQWKKYEDKKIINIPELKKLKKLKNKLIKTDGFDILLVGCGTSYHSGLSSRWFYDSHPFRTVRCVVASEFTKQDLPKGLKKNPKNVLAILISQSGETLDTYRALNIIKNANIPTIALVNVPQSLIARECDYTIHLNAGREVGVASTKAYVTQIIGLHLIATYFKCKNGLKISNDYKILSSQIKQVLHKYFSYKEIDNKYQFTCPEDFLGIINSLNINEKGFSLASGSLRATAYEASLKIKEIGRIFFHGSPTAALKHGPFSLIEKDFPIIFALQKGENDVLRRTNTAIDEISLRGGEIYLVTDIEDYENKKVKQIIKIPHNKTFSSILTIIPFQIISFYLAIHRNLDCDKPINLAKCVTTD